MKSKKLIITIVTVAMVLLVLVGCDTIEKADYVLTIDIEGEGGSVVSPGEGAYVYEYGEDVPIIVDIYEGFELVEWTGPDGDKVEKDGNNYKIKINGNMEICAVFAREGTATDEALFNFEEDIQGFKWAVEYEGDASTVNATLTTDSELSYAGDQSLRVDYHFTSPEASSIDIFVENLASEGIAYGIFKFRVYVPEESGIEFFQAFVQTEAYDWNNTNCEEVDKGEWIELEVDMSDNENKGKEEIYKLGIQIKAPSDTTKLSGSIYIDSIDVDS